MTNLEWLRTAPEEEVAELLDDIDIGGYFTLWWLTQPLDRCKYYEVCGNKENCEGCKGKETV